MKATTTPALELQSRITEFTTVDLENIQEARSPFVLYIMIGVEASYVNEIFQLIYFMPFISFIIFQSNQQMKTFVKTLLFQTKS